LLDLDVRTLFIVSISVTMVLGFLLLFAWYQNREIRALGWWAVGHFVMCAGCALLSLRGFLPDVVSIDIANAMILIAAGIGWGGARLFDDRPVPMSACLPAQSCGCSPVSFRYSMNRSMHGSC